MKTRIQVMTRLRAGTGIATAQAHDGYGSRHDVRRDRGHFVGRGPWRREGPRLTYREPFRSSHAPAGWLPPVAGVGSALNGAFAPSLNLPPR